MGCAPSNPAAAALEVILSTTKVLHSRVSILKRNSPKSAALRSAAYRSGENLVNPFTGEMHDFRRREVVQYSGILAPAGSPDWVYNRSVLWAKSDAAETRKDAQLAREIVFSLPYNLSRVNRKLAVEDFIRTTINPLGMVADYAIHAHGSGDKRNAHVHIMLPTRQIFNGEFTRKNRDWNDPKLAKMYRECFANVVNHYLAQDLQSPEITAENREKTLFTAKSFADQGLDRVPLRRVSRGVYWARKHNIPETEKNVEKAEKVVYNEIKGVHDAGENRGTGVVPNKQRSKKERGRDEDYGY